MYTNPERVFNYMLANNFATVGYSRSASIKSEQMSQNESTQIQFGKQNVAVTKVAMSGGGSVDKAEVISTPTNDFLRYTKIKHLDADGKDVGGSKAVGLWARADQPGQLNQSFSRQTLFATYFPMGIVPENAKKDTVSRSELLDYISKNTVYSPNFNTVKHENIDGRRVVTYQVSVQLQAYAEMLQKFATATGQGSNTAGLSPADYAGTQPVKLVISVDEMSHRLARVLYPDNANVSELYSGYGINNSPVQMPDKFISAFQLQELLQ